MRLATNGQIFMAILDIFLLILVTIIWGVNFAIAKLGMDQLPPLFLSAMRFSVVAFAIFFIPRPKVDWRIIFGIAIFIGVIKFSLLFVALDIGFGAGLSSVVVQGQVFFTIILAFLLYGERLNLFQIIGLIIGFAGLIIMGFDEGDSFNLTGFFMVVLAAICWAMANMFFRKAGNATAVAVIVWASLIAAGPIWILSFVFEGPVRIADAFMNFDAMGIFAVLYVSMLSTLFCYSFWGKMLSKYRAADVTPFALLIPVSGLLGGIFLLNESISTLAQIGIFVIMAGLGISVIDGRISRKNKLAN
tara:strand:- start:1847 stop:2755 length:909 start_codon:yes stop_codon:yes gene_type:complete